MSNVRLDEQIPFNFLDLQDYYTSVAKRKFPEKYEELVRKYGAVEFVISEDGKDVEDIEAPIDYLNQSDQRELRRWFSGDFGYHKSSRPLTASGLLKIAESQLANCKAEWNSIRQDPSLMQSLVRAAAEFAPETLPHATDPKNAARTPEQLLSTPMFIGMKIRYFTHNFLLRCGDWSLITEYLREIKKFDEDEGRYGRAIHLRVATMSQVKNILDQQRSKRLREFRISLLASVPELRRFAKRTKDHPDYAGSVVEILAPEEDKMESTVMLAQKTFKGSLYRVLFAEAGPFATWTDDRFIADMSSHFATANDEEKAILSDEALNAFLELESISDFIVMLGTDGEDFKKVPHEARYIKHAEGGQFSQKIFASVTIEKHVKNIAGLPSKMNRIWKDIDASSMKKAKTTIEKVVAFTEVKPSWNFKPPKPVQPVDKAEPKLESSKRKPRPRPKTEAAKDREPEPEPANIKPFTDQKFVDPEAGEVDVVSKGDKIKTRKDGNALHEPEVEAEEPLDDAEPFVDPKTDLVKYKVRRHIYGTFEQLLDHCTHPVPWVNFKKAMEAIGFVCKTRGGSKRVFLPPDDRDKPLFVHEPHSRTTGSETDTVVVGKWGDSLKMLYGFSMKTFVLR